MATRSSILAWRIPWTEEPGRLPSIGSQRVGHDPSGLARLHACTRLGRICGGQGCGDETEVDRAGFGSDDKGEDIGWEKVFVGGDIVKNGVQRSDRRGPGMVKVGFESEGNKGEL